MTFSLLLHDPETGEFGSVISSSSPAVASRCVFLVPGHGAVHSQNVTDPGLGLALSDALRAGDSADKALSSVCQGYPENRLQYRQLLVLDAQGCSAQFSGNQALGVHGCVSRPNVIAGGNMLASLEVLDALVDTAIAAEGGIEERLISALEAAIEAGGEAGPVHSAGLSVVSDAPWRVTDLRVDWSDSPVEDLRRALTVWLPQREDYLLRARSPECAPSYGVPGDE